MPGQTYLLVMLLGFPLGMLVIAALGAYFYRGGSSELLDWKPTRSPKREAQLQVNEVHQMLDAQNRYRRQRGAPERSLEEVTGHAGVHRDWNASTHRVSIGPHRPEGAP